MKYKVTGTYYVEDSSWIGAEQQVEQKLVNADQIESDPANKTARDMILYGIASRILEEHNNIFFSTGMNDTYDKKVEVLKAETLNWLDNLLEETIKTNEQNWV